MENVCCGILEKVNETYKLPFYQPWILKDGERNLTKGNWLAKLFILTPDGEISEEPAPFIELTFCPFCGVRLAAEEEETQ